MDLPEAVTMVEGRFGTAGSMFGEDVSIRVEVRPTHDLVWSATGQAILSFSKVFSVPPGVEGKFKVPAVNQDGWRLQSTLANFTMWAYIVDITYTSQSGVTKRRSVEWQPLLGQTSVDLDLIAGGPVSSPISGVTALVTSVAGLSGAVTLEQLNSLGIGGGNSITPAAVDAKIATAVTNLVNGAPSALNTLKELADALAADDADILALNNALSTKASIAYVDQAIANLVNGAPAALNTLKELADALAADDTDINAINTALAARATITYVDQQIAANASGHLALGSSATTAKAGDWTPGYGDLPTGIPIIILRTAAIPNPARPAVPSTMVVFWVDKAPNLGTPTNWTGDDLYFGPDVAAEITAALTYTANGEEGTNGNTVGNTSPSPFNYKDLGSATNTQTYSNATPTLNGGLAYRISQISGGTNSNLGVTGLTANDRWAVTMYGIYESMPTQSGGCIFLKTYQGSDVTTGTASAFTCYTTASGNMMLYAGSGATPGSNQVKVAETGAGVITAGTKWRLRLGGDVPNNKLRMVVDSGPSTAILYDSAWFTPASTGAALQFTGLRCGFGTSGSTAATALRFEVYVGAVSSGTVPGLLTV